MRVIVYWLVLSSPVLASCRDTIRTTSFWELDSRLNSTGHFPYTGSLVNKNLNFDINLYRDRNGYGFFVFKSFDLEDRKSIVNYLQPGIFKRFLVSKRVSLTPFVGYVFSQTKSFSDKDSDGWVAAVISWKASPVIKIENTFLILNVAKNENTQSVNNRLHTSFLTKHFTVESFLWLRKEEGMRPWFVSCAAGIKLARVKITKYAFIYTSFLYQFYLTETYPSYAMRQGSIFSIAAPLKY